MTNAHNKEVVYRLIETQAEYRGLECKLAVIYSNTLEETKRKTCLKKVEKEKEAVEKSFRKYKNRTFKCLADAEKEVELLQKKAGSKLKCHEIETSVVEIEKKRPGRPSKNPENNRVLKEYKLQTEIQLDESLIEEHIRRECTFILCSNDLSITGEKLLREYKTQSDVEKRFKVLKSPTFMNSLFLKSPHRVEALVYILLISLMMMTVAEKVVRDELKSRGDVLYGIENRKLKKPSLENVLKIMNRVRVVTYLDSGKVFRKIINIDESCKKIIKFLKIPESCFAWNDSDYE
ncbi:MAG: IS1634 family transposase, partial [Tissierellia bacterium]|nr:IS1634 family transposase [Tissierellia bacterium]